MDEQIICFKKELLSAYLNQSKVFYDESLLHHVLDNLQSIPRADAENDFRFKQLIVYTVIKSGDLYLTYKRTPETGEKRLSEKYSLGIGGHVDIADREQLSLFGNQNKEIFIYHAIWREIKEEIDIKSSNILTGPKIICFINDDSNDVGRVHFGIVCLLKIREPKVSRKRGKGEGKGISEFEFYDLYHLKAKKPYFEKWSQLLIDDFIEKGDKRWRC